LSSGFNNILSAGGQVGTSFMQGIGNLQTMWNNAWSPTGAGISGFPNAVTMVANAFTGAGGLVQGMQDNFTKLAQGITQQSPVVGAAMQAAGDVITGQWSSLPTALGTVVNTGFTTVKSTITDAGTSLGAAATTAFSAVTAAAAPVSNLGSTIASGMASAVGSVTSAVGSIGSALGLIPSEKTVSITGNAAGATAAASAAVAAIEGVPPSWLSTLEGDASGLISACKDALNWLAQIPNEIFTYINGIFSSGSSSSGGTLPSKQLGGMVPETGVYLLHQGEEVIPANQVNHPPITTASAAPTQTALQFQNETTVQVDGATISRLIERRQIQRRNMAAAYK
jgi:hypothetical protein